MQHLYILIIYTKYAYVLYIIYTSTLLSTSISFCIQIFVCVWTFTYVFAQQVKRFTLLASHLLNCLIIDNVSHSNWTRESVRLDPSLTFDLNLTMYLHTHTHTEIFVQICLKLFHNIFYILN